MRTSHTERSFLGRIGLVFRAAGSSIASFFLRDWETNPVLNEGGKDSE